MISNGKTITGIHWHEKTITAVYTAMKEVWSLITSCFGNGYWIDGLSWIDSDVWKD